MIDRPLKSAVVAAVSALMTIGAAPAPFNPAPQRSLARDGEVSTAACAAVGITLRAQTRPVPMPAAPPRLQVRPASPTPPAGLEEEVTQIDDIIVTGSRMPGDPTHSPTPLVTVTGEQMRSTGQSTVIDYLATVPAMSNSVAPPPPPSVQPDTERYPDARPNPVHRVADTPVSTFSIDVDTAAYANTRRFIDEGRAPPADAVRVEELVNYFDYGYARPRSAREPFAVTTVVAASPWSPGRQIVHIGLQGYELPDNERRPLNLTFLVDVSGSMDSPDKLELAQKSMNLIIDRLRPQDRVAVTYYAEGAGTTLAPTPGDQKLKLRCAVASLYASGGTAGATGMTNAYDQAQVSFARDRVNRILMFTDGDFNVGQTNNQRLEDYVAAKRETGIYLSVYGFGRGNYQDERMQTIAQAGNGTAAYVDDLNEARRLFGPMFDRGAFPIADDVKIQVEFNPARVSEYRLIGYETRLLNEADFNNDRVDAGEVGSGAAVTALYEITPVGGPSQVPERRYEQNRPAAGGDASGEIGFVQVRYKLPGGTDSRLIQQAVSNGGRPGASAQPPESTRWAIAVAAFGQRLRGDPWMPADYSWDQIAEQAQGARGQDPYGDRAEFVQLVRAAQGLPARGAP